MKFKLINEAKKKADIKVENPGVLEVPEGKKVYDLPVSHFKKLIDKKGRAKIIRAINNLSIWSKNDDKKMHNWAEDMKKSLDGYGEKKDESLFEGWQEDVPENERQSFNFKGALYNELAHLFFIYHRRGYDVKIDEFDDAIDNFRNKFFI